MAKPRIIPRTRLQVASSWTATPPSNGPLASEMNSLPRTTYILHNVEYMVVTRRAVFRKGYKGTDDADIPRFKEGEREGVARDLLKEEGLGHLQFVTCLDLV
ncbi:hypothetical protein ARMGADRAFT_1077993 [Armillaria gallica]|uniref:Uncharacterized protein n=1 Tax=Armillaria gallica TaxID=47427 RepID=A0A2H3E3V3_ARMGA|nr:hypothetical protein ARMGADRAFT_1077993 [Armillaria gallica]